MRQPNKEIRIKVRQNALQFWLPKYISIPHDHELFDELHSATKYMRQSSLDLINYLNHMKQYSTIDEKVNVAKAVEPVKPAVKRIHIVDEAELDGVTGGDIQQEPQSSYAVEFNPDMGATWKPSQTNGNVAVTAPPFVGLMHRRQKDDLRKMQQ